MSQVRVAASRWVRIGVGPLALALVLCAAARGQDARPPKETPQAPVNLPPAQQPVPVVHPVAAPAANAPNQNGSQINLTEEIVTSAMILIFTAGFVLALAVVARFFFGLAAPKDLDTFALGDPWVRARLAQLDATAVKKRRIKLDE